MRRVWALLAVLLLMAAACSPPREIAEPSAEFTAVYETPEGPRSLMMRQSIIRWENEEGLIHWLNVRSGERQAWRGADGVAFAPLASDFDADLMEFYRPSLDYREAGAETIVGVACQKRVAPLPAADGGAQWTAELCISDTGAPVRYVWRDAKGDIVQTRLVLKSYRPGPLEPRLFEPPLME